MGIDLSGYVKKENLEECEQTKKVASKFGIQVVCSEEELDENQPQLHVPEGEECENSKKVATKYGVQVICDEEA